ncbi:adhesion G protein-coupled receptor L4 isoform X2 [Pocillopora verrucosa]|uniref:adhesion G protein-coupled receptor L4 isoform X2 n=1 Tax=Pocillopora verrucosa TaxID=203993 RepID=UPI00333E89ED
MSAKACQIWGIVLFSVTLLRFARLDQDSYPVSSCSLPLLPSPSSPSSSSRFRSPFPSLLPPSSLSSLSSSLLVLLPSSTSRLLLVSSSSSSLPPLLPSSRSLLSSSRLQSPLSSSHSSTSHSFPSLLPTLSLSSLSSSLLASSSLSTSRPLLLSLSSSSSSSLSSPNLTSPPVTIERLAIEYVSKLGAIELKRESSLKGAMRLFNDFTNQYQQITKPFKGQLGEEEVKKGTAAIFKVAVAFEKFVLNYSRYHLNRTKLLKKMTDSRMVVRMKIGYQNDPNNFFLEEEEWQTSINISSANFAKNGSVVVGCLYKDLHELLLTKQSIGNETHNSRYVNTRITTAAMDPKPEILQDLILKFRNLKVVEEKKHCMFWSGFSKSPDGYSEDGCHVDTAKSNSEETVCRCNHLTYFAVLVDFDSDGTKLSKKDGTILETITYVGLSLSVIGMLLTIVLYSFLTDVREPLSQIRLSLSVSLGAGQIIFLAGINATENMAACITAAALIQYFLMAAFCWMLVEGIYLYLFVVKVYNINTKMHMYHVISWGLPVVMVAISLSIAAGKEGMKSFTSDKYCWLSSTNKPIWIFVAFVAFIESLNILILVRVIKEITTLVEPLAEDNYARQIRAS